MNTSLRSIALAFTMATTAVAGHAATLLALPFQGTQSNSTMVFSQNAMGSYALMKISVVAKGNATAVSGTTDSFTFPVTKVAIGTNFGIASGAATGSALYISRMNTDTTTGITSEIGVTMANFTINYDTKQVFADFTPKGGTVIPQMPLYTFTVATPLALKYQFPLTITGHEVLNNLLFTDQAKQALISALALPSFVTNVLGLDFGSLTQDITTHVRKPAASTAPYVAN